VGSLTFGIIWYNNIKQQKSNTLSKPIQQLKHHLLAVHLLLVVIEKITIAKFHVW
jgi:hypothetical protein